MTPGAIHSVAVKSNGLYGFDANVWAGMPVRTTFSDKTAPCPLDHVNRQFHAPAPNMLWVSDFTYVATWAGFVYVAFVIDAYARRIVGWRASRTAQPNARIVSIADRLLKRDGRMVRAIEAIGVADPVSVTRALLATTARKMRSKVAA